MSNADSIKIWRVYNNGSITDETRVLGPHSEGTGYNGDVDAWSEHNKKWRFGCAQIVKKGDEYPVVIYEGYLDAERLKPILEELNGL